jgi:hypothetical protein
VRPFFGGMAPSSFADDTNSKNPLMHLRYPWR